MMLVAGKENFCLHLRAAWGVPKTFNIFTKTSIDGKKTFLHCHRFIATIIITEKKRNVALLNLNSLQFSSTKQPLLNEIKVG